MKISTTGTKLVSNLAPLRAIDKMNESINCDHTMIAIRQEGDRKYLIAATDQPQYTVFLHLNLSGNPENKDSVDMSIDRNAVACECNEHYRVKNSEMMAFLRNVGSKDAEFVVTEAGMSASIKNEQSLLIPAERIRHQLDFVREAAINEYDNKDGFTHGEVSSSELSKALKAPIAVAKLGSKTGSLYSKAVHLVLAGNEFGVEALSNTVFIKCTNNKNGALPSGEGSVHLSISAKVAQVLMQICSLTDKSVQWLYDSNENFLMVWCSPYFMSIYTEEIGHQDLPVKVSGYSTLSVDRIRFANAVKMAKNTGCKSLRLQFGENGYFCVHTPDNEFNDEFAGEHLGEKYVDTLTVPVDTLSACLCGYESGKITLCCEEDRKFLAMSSEDRITCILRIIKG